MNQVVENKSVDDSIVRKIQLLLNLAANPGTEAEGVAAMNRAQDILARYNLDLATVQDKVVAGGTAAREAESKRDYSKISRSAQYAWQQKLVRTIAEANFCVYWVDYTHDVVKIAPSRTKYEGETERRREVKRHKILGRVVNTTAVLIMVDYLFDTIERLLPYPTAKRMSSEATLWREGCVDRLCERVAAKAEAMKKADYATQGEAAYTTAIQVADMAEKEEAANYDFLNGAGAWAARKQRVAEMNLYWSDEAVAQRAAAREAELAAKRALETPAQRASREADEAKEARRQEKASERFSERYWREQDRKEARKNSSAYRAGQAKGAEIGLDGQLNSTTTKNLK